MNRTRVTATLFLLPLAVSAQAPQDVAPLKYWPAPLYWQPTHAELRVPAKTEIFSASPEAATPAQIPASSLVFVAMTPCRLVDTRAGFGFTGFFGPPSLVAGATRAFPISSSTNNTPCSVPTLARAYSFNITVVPPGPLGYLSIWPVGSAQPNASTLNDTLGGVIANAAIVPAGNDASGSVNVFVSNNTDLIVDINGYYAPQSGITLTQGTAAAPSLSFASDPTTGIFSSGAGTVNIATGGTNRLTVRSDGDVDVPGSLRKNGTLFLHNLGSFNLGVGLGTLGASTGSYNVGSGHMALGANTTGSYSTANGYAALGLNTTGSYNTASGLQALYNNTTASYNTAHGYAALFSNATGSFNTAVGMAALEQNNGDDNTATGADALQTNTIGASNTADGFEALNSNTIGYNNTAVGWSALAKNTTAPDNTAVGWLALNDNTTGCCNTAVGGQALDFTSTGSSNIAIGYLASNNVTGGGSNNIHIGSAGASADSSTIRIGTAGYQSSFFAAGIRGVTTGVGNAVPVLIDTNGQLGTASSSIRFKEDVHDMAGVSSGLLRLRPVTYRYKQPYADGSKPIDYGLIAEEVAEVYPDLVVKGSDGQVETVQYQKLTPMLLNEVQKQADAIRELQAELAALKTLIATPAGK